MCAFAWWAACEALRERAPWLLALFAVGPFVMLVAVWWPERWSDVRGAIALLASLLALDIAADLWIPYQRRFVWPAWELLHVSAAFVGVRLATRSPYPRVARLVRGTSLAVVALVLTAMVYLRITGWRDETTRSDAALVLGFALDASGHARPSLVARVAHAADLYHGGLVPILVLSGGSREGLPPESTVMRDLALADGVPDRAIVLETHAQNTRENLTLGAATLRSLHAAHVLIVTEPFHMPTAMVRARRAGLDARPSPASSEASRSVRACSYWLFRDALEFIADAARP